MSIDPHEIFENEFYVLDSNGKLFFADEYEADDEDFRRLLNKEVFLKSVDREESPHIKYLNKLKIADNEPLSDAGHLSYLPNGALMLELLRRYSTNVILSLGAYPVVTSIMYDLNSPPVKEHASLFGQRMYKVKPAKREFVLRYAACFGQFAMLSRKYITYKDLPLRVFELADSYRYEQRGELSGLTRVRRFFMPDMHVLTKDMEMAKEEFFNLYKLILDEGRKFGWVYYSLYNMDPTFLKENFDFIKSLANLENKPILIHTVEGGKYYWVLNVEFHYIDSTGRPVETATVQIDVGNGERFNITYVDENGLRKHPIILHTAIHGSLERFLFEFLEEAAKMERRGVKPRLPVWLTPIQVRIIPVNPSKNMNYAMKVLNILESKMIRVDVDDRDVSMGRRIKDAESFWIPYIVVIGDKEEEEGKLSVRIRDGAILTIGVEEFIDILDRDLEGYPRERLYINKFISRRTSFA
ncbi:TPA: threonine--tRNA ligase [Candidatus Geothermarchaeota archaeon]|nr:threonine--tRNA ligase [Candidatus Geothermarchaeota archaeon]